MVKNTKPAEERKKKPPNLQHVRDGEPPCDQNEWGKRQKIGHHRDDGMCSFSTSHFDSETGDQKRTRQIEALDAVNGVKMVTLCLPWGHTVLC